MNRKLFYTKITWNFACPQISNGNKQRNLHQFQQKQSPLYSRDGSHLQQNLKSEAFLH